MHARDRCGTGHTPPGALAAAVDFPDQQTAFSYTATRTNNGQKRRAEQRRDITGRSARANRFRKLLLTRCRLGLRRRNPFLDFASHDPILFQKSASGAVASPCQTRCSKRFPSRLDRRIPVDSLPACIPVSVLAGDRQNGRFVDPAVVATSPVSTFALSRNQLARFGVVVSFPSFSSSRRPIS